jgi:hypothetical protein
LAGASALAASAVVVASLPATGQSTGERVPYEQIWGPIGTPDRVVLTPTETPATSQAVSWRTSTDVATPVAEIAVAEPGPGFKNYGGRSGRNEVTVVPGEVTGDLYESLAYPMRFHTAVFEGLEPDTTYIYRVGDGSPHNRTNWSEWFEFTTATEGADDFSFIYVGDAQNDIKEHASRVFRRAIMDRPEAEIFLSAGDLIDVWDRDYEWGEWFHANFYTTGNINQIATPGNHEYSRDHGPNDMLAAYWSTQFNYPDNGPQAPDGTENTTPYEMLGQGNVYYVDYKGVRFVSLDSQAPNALPSAQRQEIYDIQAEWLDEVLTDNPNKWTVLTFHHPVFSVSAGRDNPMLRNTWLPIIEKHDVDLVLTGHDHTYGQGYQANAAQGGSNHVHNGTVFAVSVSGPKMYNVSGQVWADNYAVLVESIQDTQLYQLIDVSKNEINYEARDATGELRDGFHIRKTDNGKRFVKQTPRR